MATLDLLKQTLREKATATTCSPTQPLSDQQYDAGFNILVRGSERVAYQDFIIPQLAILLGPLFNSRICISVLEIGPGPESTLGSLPNRLKRKIKRYAAFEPNHLFATRLEEWLGSTSETGFPLPCLESQHQVHRAPFVLDSDIKIHTDSLARHVAQKFDVILFCHSMYGMKPKRRFIERALEMLSERPRDGMVVVFHRDGNLHFDGLTCHRTASFPAGVVRVTDNDEVLDRFASFIAGFVIQDGDVNNNVKIEWRKVCRELGRRKQAHPEYLLFSAPEIMAAFTQHATMLPELTAQVSLVIGDNRVKNREARLHRPASMIRPTKIHHVQQCVRWALSHKVSLTVVGGSHSGHCLWPNVVSVDMGAFDQIHVLKAGGDSISDSDSDSLVVVEAGCKYGDMVRETMAAGLTVPLGARPSIGAGLWLQGGIGHLARLHGLACDASVGVVVISIASSEVLCVGRVPSQYWPADAVRPDKDNDLLWAMKGAGTNMGIVISVVFKAYPAPTYSIQNWIVSLRDNLDARLRLSNLDASIAQKLPRHCSVDVHLYWDADKLHLGVTMFESCTTTLTLETPTSTSILVGTEFGPESDSKVVDSVGLFESDMYMSGMHGGHSSGKTSSFKRCIFLKRIGGVDVASILVAAIETRPSPLWYLHLLQGGGAVGDVADNATAFGCRDWDFACVITGVWPREEDGTRIARAAVQWVYDVASDLLPLSSGAYGADLGPDPRDAALAAKAFGPNSSRLARLKHFWDPADVLAYACPLPKAPMNPKLIMLVTGESGAGKDYCAEVWVSELATCSQKSLKVRAVSISNTFKREYAAATGANLKDLLHDRAYKEKHRPQMSTYFRDQARQRPQLPEGHFMQVVYGAVDVNVLLITGMRDEAPVATLSHLVPGSRLLEVCVKASNETRWARRMCEDGNNGGDDQKGDQYGKTRHSLVFDNGMTGEEAAVRFCEQYLSPFISEDLQKLADMVRIIPSFPRSGIEFRDVLGISQQPGGLALCTSLLQAHFTGDWGKVDVVACCEIGGLVFASALAVRVNISLALIREAGKLPQPTIPLSNPRHTSRRPHRKIQDRKELRYVKMRSQEAHQW